LFQQRRKIITEYHEKLSSLYRERFELLHEESTLQNPEDEGSFLDTTKEKYKALIEEFESSTANKIEKPNNAQMATPRKPSD